MKNTFTLFAALLLAATAAAQSYTYFPTGDTSDFVTAAYLPGLVLEGGGSENDQALQWMLQRAGGGDVVVIRASGSDGYNDYLYSELGIGVNSVETIRFNTAAAATDSFVIRRIRQAEVLFIAGGDQYDYYQYWKDTPIEDALNYLINEKKITVGGTSAGMAILAENYYVPPGSSAESPDALLNPFYGEMDIIGMSGFLEVPYMADVITDTHYDQRTRAGRHLAFLARVAGATGERSFGIACNESTVVCVDGEGIAHVFGQNPPYLDYAYFLQSNCQPEFLPEMLTPGQPLTWSRNQAAVKVYRAPGKPDGSTTFDLNDWQTGTGGAWYNWYAENGTLIKSPTADAACDAFVSAAAEASEAVSMLEIWPNPAGDVLRVQWPLAAGQQAQAVLQSAAGVVCVKKMITQPGGQLEISAVPPGIYFLKLETETGTWARKVVKY